MKTEVEKLEGNKVKLKVEVPSQVLDGALRKTYKELSQRLFVPGFRKGKIPQKVIDAQVGRDAVVARAAEEIINSRYPEALVRSGVDPIEQPQVNVVRAEPGEDLVFEADVEVKPEAKLGDYKNIEVTLPGAGVIDDEVEEQVDILRQRFARLEVVEDRPLEKGDYALIDFKGSVEAEDFEGSSAEDYMIEVGSGTLLPELEGGLVGMERGQTKRVEVGVPEDFPNKAIAGKKASFELTLKEIKQKILPELDDEFVSESTEHETVEELRHDLRKKMELVKRAQTKVQAESRVLEELAKNAEVEVSEKLIELEVENMVEELARNLRRQGSTIDEYLKMTNSDLDKVREEFRKNAEERIRRELAIIAVSKAEDLTVSQEELGDEINEIAKALGKPAPEVRAQIDHKGTLPDLYASLVRRKTVDWLMTHAKAKTEEGEEIDLTPPPAPVDAADATEQTEKLEAAADEIAEEAAARDTSSDVEEETNEGADTGQGAGESEPSPGEGDESE